MSWYLTIRSDAFHSESFESARLVGFLQDLPGLVQVKPLSFANQQDRPWLLIQLAECDWRGNYHILANEFRPTVNLVELICSSEGDEEWYESIAGEIARFLGWEALVEHEERWVWPALVPEA